MRLINLFFLILLTPSLSAQSSPLSSYSIGEVHSLYSDILEENREIIVHLPSGFWGMDENLNSYPVTFVLDGESQFLNTVSAIDYLSSAPLGNDAMPRTIVVGIPNTNRNRDLTPTKGVMGRDSTMLDITGGGPKFLEFIVKELTPYIDSLYPTSTHRTIIGHSLGGLIAFDALLKERNHFNNYLVLDPALDYDNGSYYNEVLDSLNTANLNEENLFIARANTLMTFLNNKDIPEDTSDIVKLTQANQNLENAAANSEWNLNYTYKFFPNENHFSIPYPAIYEAMKYFYSFYPFREIANYYHPTYQNKTDLVARLKVHYQAISDKMGYKIQPMEGYLNSWAFGMVHFQRLDLAVQMFDYNIEIHPNKATVYNSKGYFLMGQGRKKEAILMFEKSLKLREDEGIREVMEGLK